MRQNKLNQKIDPSLSSCKVLKETVKLTAEYSVVLQSIWSWNYVLQAEPLLGDAHRTFHMRKWARPLGRQEKGGAGLAQAAVLLCSVYRHEHLNSQTTSGEEKARLRIEGSGPRVAEFRLLSDTFCTLGLNRNSRADGEALLP